MNPALDRRLSLTTPPSRLAANRTRNTAHWHAACFPIYIRAHAYEAPGLHARDEYFGLRAGQDLQIDERVILDAAHRDDIVLDHEAEEQNRDRDAGDHSAAESRGAAEADKEQRGADEPKE